MTTARATSILVAEDDDTVSDVVTRYLRREGFSVHVVGDGRVALEKAAASAPDLVVLDIMLPGMDGLEVCRRLRAVGAIPIIMLTALGDESDRVLGLEIGADDYLTKPFSPRELVARVKSVLRRTNGPLEALEEERVLVAGDLEADIGAREVRMDGVPVSLTVREFELLAFLMLHSRHVFTRDELLERVWGSIYGDRSTVTVHVRRLREKLEPEPARPRHIKTVWGVGYRFDP